MLTVRGQSYLTRRKPILLPISIGNPYFSKRDNLDKLCKFSQENSDQVKIFIPEVIEEHNLKAVGCTKPHKRSRQNANSLRNKCMAVIKDLPATAVNKFSFTDWRKEVEENHEYLRHLSYIMELFDKHQEFKTEVSKVTNQALRNTFRARGGREEESMVCPFDVSEGVNYYLKELAFFMSIPSIYEGYDEYIYVYHREAPPVLEKLFTGIYDGNCKPYFGYFTLN